MYQTVMRLLNDMPNPGSNEEQAGEQNGSQSAGTEQQG